MRILVTGATGFVGKAFLAHADVETNFSLRAAVRNYAQDLPKSVEVAIVEGLTGEADWREALNGCDVVVHAAARVHIMQDSASDPLDAFRRVNVAGTLNLARQASSAGVKRFVFISSVKVNGENTLPEKPFSSEDGPVPVDPYGISKCEAECALKELSTQTGMDLVIIRPPLVYGPGVKANFLDLMKIVDRGIPMPIGSIENCRSLLYLGNFIDAIVATISHPKAAGQTYLLSDGEDVSTPDLVCRLAKAFGKTARLISIPPALMRVAGRVTGKKAAVDRIFGSLVVDSGKIRRELGWDPPFTLQEGLEATVKWYRSSN